MNITNIKIQNLRLIKNIELDPYSGINLIIGNNGAGKTTILEALYLLARNRSFKSSSIKNIIRQEQNDLTIKASINHSNGYTQHLALQKTKNQTRFTINGQPQKKLTTIAKSLPIGIITPNIHRIFEEGPIHRRRLIDWGVFHVEHNYQSLVKDYRKVLLQRNAALQKDILLVKIWDEQFLKISEEITLKRMDYLKQMSFYVNKYLNSFPIFENVDFDLYTGWNTKYSLTDCLYNSLVNDSKRGFTSVGPHRADVVIKIKSKYAKEVLSRGQQKILATLLVLANLSCLKQKTNESGILLYDDINSELDLNNLNKIISLIISEDIQAFITTLNGAYKNDESRAIKVFHVEHGEII